jgi:hypothetical protein
VFRADRPGGRPVAERRPGRGPRAATTS